MGTKRLLFRENKQTSTQGREPFVPPHPSPKNQFAVISDEKSIFRLSYRIRWSLKIPVTILLKAITVKQSEKCEFL